MHQLSFDSDRRILMARLSGVFGSEELAALDADLVHFLSRQPQPESVRGLLDFRDVVAIALPESKVVERARRPPIVRGQRVMVAPTGMGDSFAMLYRAHQRLATGKEPTVVNTLEEALEILGVTAPNFEPVTE
ncbi:MAG: hypothetical protein JSR90_24980 [Proteobacteria bacterium]|nr:hypothetical protein [Pseudomonadota bacterium]